MIFIEQKANFDKIAWYLIYSNQLKNCMVYDKSFHRRRFVFCRNLNKEQTLKKSIN